MLVIMDCKEAYKNLVEKVQKVNNQQELLAAIYNDEYIMKFYNFHNIKINPQNRLDFWHEIILMIGSMSDEKFNDLKQRNKLIGYVCGMIINMLFLSGTAKQRKKFIYNDFPLDITA